MTDQLKEGFARFRQKDGMYGDDGIMPGLVQNGQQPDYFVISCMDSRSAPATIFDAAPGTMFAHKPMGAMVPPYNPENKENDLAAKLRYALHHVGVSKIIVVGHSHCGAVKALANKIDEPEIMHWVNTAKKANARARAVMRITKEFDNAALLRETERQVVRLSVENLTTYPAVREAMAEGKVEIRGWLFEMEHGNLFEYDPASKGFKQVFDYNADQIGSAVPDCDHEGHEARL